MKQPAHRHNEGHNETQTDLCSGTQNTYSSKLSGFLPSFGTNPNLTISDLPA